jgi:class 3 adenylate cyclase
VAPTTQYARTRDGLHIAFQTYGAGPVDLLYVPQSFSQVEHLWESPIVARYFERLGSFARVIAYDRRESGLSDRVGRPSTLEEQIDDVIAVLDAAGADRVGIFALMEGTPMAMLFAATHPERAGALVLFGPFARTTAAPGYAWAPTHEERAARFARITDGWGDGALLDVFAPSHAHDPRLRAWIGKLQRVSMSPGTARMISDVNADLDVRHVLPSIRVPTLVLRRIGDEAIDARHVRYVAEQIPNARLVELPGVDGLPFAGDMEAVAGELEEFLTGTRTSAEIDRVLATVVFTDVCGSTERAARMGDRAWRDLLGAHDALVRAALERHAGREIKTVGDGVLAMFDGPARAIRAGRAIAAGVRELDLEVRVGMHTGESEVIGGDVGGLAVHIAARVMALAQPGEVLVSQTVKDLVAGSGLRFADRGVHSLRGVPDEWRVWAVEG